MITYPSFPAYTQVLQIIAQLNSAISSLVTFQLPVFDTSGFSSVLGYIFSLVPSPLRLAFVTILIISAYRFAIDVFIMSKQIIKWW